MHASSRFQRGGRNRKNGSVLCAIVWADDLPGAGFPDTGIPSVAHVFEQLQEWKRVAKRDTRVSYMALRDPRTPWHVKALAAVMALHAISPVDIIPDVIPLHGVLDDVLVIPLAIALMVHLLPTPLKTELQSEAEAHMAVKRPRRHIAEVVILICVLGIAGVTSWLVWFR